MVIYSDTAHQNLEDILYGLVTWKKHPLSVEHALQYVSEIRQHADTICTKNYHAHTVYLSHQKYGSKVLTYRRNQQTQWFILYDWNMLYRIAYVNKIVNNHQTT